MSELLEASLAFPTVVFTVGLGIVLVYWLFVVLGALDIDLFGGGDVGDALAGGAKGGAEAMGDALAGGVKGGAEALKGGAEALKGAKADLGDTGFWHALGLASVPITISISVVLLVGWVASLLAMHWLPGLVGGLLGAGLAPLVLVGVFVAALPVSGQLVRPLAPVFKVRTGKTNRDYIGSICTISTGWVDDGFGQATIEDGGTVLVITVHADRADALGRGDSALIIDFDLTRQAYLVVPADIFSSGVTGSADAPPKENESADVPVKEN